MRGSTTMAKKKLTTITKKYTLKCYDVNDRLRLPWDIVVADTNHRGTLTVQEPYPDAGSNLIGFEIDPQECEVFVPGNPEWHEQAVDKHPVFAHAGGMFSLRGIKVSKVIDQIQADLDAWSLRYSEETGRGPGAQEIIDWYGRYGVDLTEPTN